MTEPSETLGESIRRIVGQIEQRTPDMMAEAREILLTLGVTEIELARNLMLAELRIYETVLLQAMAAMRSELEAGGTVVATEDVIARLGDGVRH